MLFKLFCTIVIKIVFFVFLLTTNYFNDKLLNCFVFSNKKQFEQTKRQIVFWVFVCVIGIGKLENSEWSNCFVGVCLCVWVWVWRTKKGQIVLCAVVVFWLWETLLVEEVGHLEQGIYIHMAGSRFRRQASQGCRPPPPHGLGPISPPPIRLTIQAES